MALVRIPSLAMVQGRAMVIFTVPALAAVSLTRLGLHPIATVAVTFLAYWAAGFGVIEWRALHRHAGKHAILHAILMAP